MTAFSQLQDANWHFGEGNAIEFLDNNVTLYESVIDSPIDRTPSCISDPLGELLYFADNELIYTANNVVMPNATFAQPCEASIFIPRPDNPDQHYFIRSLGLNGIDYSVIDLNLNDGLGDVIEDEKELPLFDLGGELMAVPKAVGLGFWLITADNNNGTGTAFIRVFDVNQADIIFHSEFSVDWPLLFFQQEMDDAIISPDCSKIACSYKGHLVGLCQFDSELGEVTSALGNVVDTQNGFFNIAELAFSPNSDYLYTIGDYNQIQQFDVSIFNGNIIEATSQTIDQVNGNTWHDIKLAPDGKIYLMNLNTGGLDVIENPDSPADEIIFTESVVMLNNAATTYFPNTPNVICGTTLFFDPQTIDVCIGETTQFNFIYNILPDSIFWEFGDPDSEELNFSEILNPTHYYEFPGSYDVTVDAWLDSLEYNFDIVANVFTYPDPQLGADITICEGDELILDAGDALSYEWTPFGNNQQFDVTESGVYSVVASNGPCSASDEIEVIVIPQLYIDLGPDFYPCDEEPVTLFANTDVVWFDNSISDSYTVSTSGTYTASLTNECFNVSDEVVVDYIVIPPFDLGDDVKGCFGDSIEVFTNIPDANVTWVSDWGLNISGDTLVITTSGSYEVTVNYYGCIETQTIEAEIVEYFDPAIIIMPNVFTPNNDDKNIRFIPIISDPTLDPCNISNLEVDMRVYNRWGGLLQPEGCFWDGRTESGDDVAEGTYYFVVDITSSCFSRTATRTINGSFSVLR